MCTRLPLDLDITYPPQLGDHVGDEVKGTALPSAATLISGIRTYRRPLRLRPRGACAALPNCPQACNGFVSENPDGSPKYSVPMSSQPKIDHSPEADLSMDVVFLLLARKQASFAPPSAALSATSTTTSPPLVQHRPVVAFSNISRPSTISVQNHRQSAASSSSVAAGVQQSRRASIQRSFHPTQPGSSTAPTALTSPKKRTSGPPRSFSTPVAPLRSLADFSPVPVVTSVKLTVGILPKVSVTCPRILKTVLLVYDTDSAQLRTMKIIWPFLRENENVLKCGGTHILLQHFIPRPDPLALLYLTWMDMPQAEDTSTELFDVTGV
ncbi:hypothetical protein B0H14DRAFT_2641643 [Mycena olivaceomarginata]|nr:hypothetical protein B0H14DRAFT_2641643 [Mycena olivaceomarginata]